MASTYKDVHVSRGLYVAFAFVLVGTDWFAVERGKAVPCPGGCRGLSALPATLGLGSCLFSRGETSQAQGQAWGWGRGVTGLSGPTEHWSVVLQQPVCDATSVWSKKNEGPSHRPGYEKQVPAESASL